MTLTKKQIERRNKIEEEIAKACTCCHPFKFLDYNAFVDKQ